MNDDRSNGSDDAPMTAPQYPTMQSLRGIAGSLPRPMPWQEVEEIAQDEHAEGVARSS